MQYYKVLNDEIKNPLFDYKEELLRVKDKLKSVGPCNVVQPITGITAVALLSEYNLERKCHSLEISHFSTLFAVIEKFCKKFNFNVNWNKSMISLIEKDAWMPWHYDAKGEEGGILIPLENYINNHEIITYWKDKETEISYTRKMKDNFFCLTKNYKTKNLIKHKTCKMPEDYFNIRISLSSINNFLKEN